MAAVFAVAGIAVVGVISVAAYQWWKNTIGADDDDVEVSGYVLLLSRIRVLEMCVVSRLTNSRCVATHCSRASLHNLLYPWWFSLSRVFCQR